MDIHMAGIDHEKAGIPVREKFSFTRKQAGAAMEQLKQRETVSGCVILSTCNRTELWLSTTGDFSENAAEILCGLKQLDTDEYAEFLDCRQGEDAVHHLLSLAAGLKSQVIGEDQILTQVGDALTLARDCYCTDQVLEVLFRTAVTAGKKVKTEVIMPRGNTSAADAAVAGMEKDGCVFRQKKCLVIGNGMMGKLTAQLLMQKGASVLVTIRQYRCGIVDTPAGAERIDYDRRYQVLPACDYVFSATSSPNLTITKERLQETELLTPKIFVDLAVPRDIEPGIEELCQVTRYDMDSFQIDEVSQEMREAFEKAEQILQTAQEEYEKWYAARDVVPQLLALSDLAAEDVIGRLEKPLKEASVYEDEMLKKAIRRSAGKVVGKLLFGIRDSVDAQTLRSCLTAMEGLYVEEGEQF